MNKFMSKYRTRENSKRFGLMIAMLLVGSAIIMYLWAWVAETYRLPEINFSKAFLLLLLFKIVFSGTGRHRDKQFRQEK